MPVYEYECGKCGSKFDIRRGVFEKERKSKCPKCGHGEVHRVYSWFQGGSNAGGSGSCSPGPAPRRFG